MHRAVRELTVELGRAALTVPMVALRAGVTPSTIYRRWGDLQDLLADVAVERLKPETPPVDLGSFEDDLAAWAVQYLEEMGSAAGREMVRDLLTAGGPAPGVEHCADRVLAQIRVLIERAGERGDPNLPSATMVVDRVVAPIMYRLLFLDDELPADYARDLVSACLRDAEASTGTARRTHSAEPVEPSYPTEPVGPAEPAEPLRVSR